MEGRSGSPGPAGARWVHVGGAYLYVDAANRLAEEPAPAPERARAEDLATALEEIDDESDALAALEDTIEGLDAATDSVERLIELVRQVVRGSDPGELATLADRLLARILRDYGEGRARDAMRLARAGLAVYLLTERWRDLVSLLQLARAGAEQVGELGEMAAAHADLSVLADAAGVALPGAEALEQLSDHAPAETVDGGLGSQPVVHGGVAVGAKVAAVAAVAVGVTGAAMGFAVGDGVWFGFGDDNGDRRAGVTEQVPVGAPRAAIVAFAAGDDTADFEVEGEDGFEIPEGAVGPGEVLGACGPTYVYHYVRYEDMVALTPYSGAILPSSGPERVAANTWDGPVDSTGMFRFRRGSEPIPYGEWTVVVEIDGVEVDRESFTLREDCQSD